VPSTTVQQPPVLLYEAPHLLKVAHLGGGRGRLNVCLMLEVTGHVYGLMNRRRVLEYQSSDHLIIHSTTSILRAKTFAAKHSPPTRPSARSH
jgi:hypothetical protein